MTITKIPVLDLSPEIDELWDEFHEAFGKVLRSNQFIMGPEVAALESEAGAYLGTPHAIGVNSGTDALVIGLRAMGIGAGDEVITTPFSFFATAESIANAGATPIFCDIELDSFNLDPTKIEEKITARTKAIMPVHLYGKPANMQAIMAIAKAHNLKVIEDCAQSFGARYVNEDSSFNGKMTGTIGEVGAYSFFPSKNLGGFGDGGLITTTDADVAEQAGMLRKHGAKKKYHNEIIGYNSRLDALQAAMLRIKLRHIERRNAGRRRVATLYAEYLADVKTVVTPVVTEGHVFHQYTIRVLDGQRDRLKAALGEAGIGSMIYYPIPQDRLPIYDGKYPANPISDQLSTEVLSLPIWPQMETEVVQHIAATVREIVG